MFSIDSVGNITLTRGDSLYLDFELFDDEAQTVPHQFSSEDNIVFRIRGGAEVTKDLEIDTTLNIATLHLVPDDTKDLDFLTYKYEVELVTADDDHFTFISNKDFKIGVEL